MSPNAQMKFENHSKTGSSCHDLIRPLIEEIERGISLIENMDDEIFRHASNGSASVGAQFRHNLDFLIAIIRGVNTGRIDYCDRERDPRVEIDRRCAIERFDAAIESLTLLAARHVGQSVSVRSEIGPEVWLDSSLAREIEFVHSHTVHHHALIAEKLARQGFSFDGNFGVAPSTIKYWELQAA